MLKVIRYAWWYKNQDVAKDVGFDLLVASAFVMFDFVHTSTFSPTLGAAILSRTGAKYLLKALARFAVGYLAGMALVAMNRRFIATSRTPTKE